MITEMPTAQQLLQIKRTLSPTHLKTHGGKMALLWHGCVTTEELMKMVWMQQLLKFQKK